MYAAVYAGHAGTTTIQGVRAPYQNETFPCVVKYPRGQSYPYKTGFSKLRILYNQYDSSDKATTYQTP